MRHPAARVLLLTGFAALIPILLIVMGTAEEKAAATAGPPGSPIFGVTIPEDYRTWQLIVKDHDWVFTRYAP